MNVTRLLAVGLLLACASAPYRFKNYKVNKQAMGMVRQSRVAVLPLAGHDGARFADEFSAELGKLGRFDVIDRQQVAELYRAQELDPYRVDQSTALNLGKTLGASAIVLGTLTDYRSTRVSASVRLVAVETGEVAWQGAAALDGDDPKVLALASDSTGQRLIGRDADYLATLLCRLMAESIK